MDARSLTYAIETPPAAGQVLEVAPGVLWIRMPLPFALDHVNLWALDDGDGWCLVDTGFNTDTIKALWGRLFDGPLAGRPVTRIIATHMHPDHIGLASWLTDRWSPELLVTQAEWLSARMLWLDDSAGLLEVYERFYRMAGLDDDGVESLKQRRSAYRHSVTPIPPVFRPIHDGETIGIGRRGWRVLTGQGHSPDHACLHAPDLNLMISGDQVLPRISPNVSVWPSAPEADPLGEYLRSFVMFSDLPDDILVLPSHGLPFRGLAWRVADLAAHHEERLAVTLRACRAPADVKSVSAILFDRPLDKHQMMFAIGETVAHLNRLVEQGRIDRRLDNGVWRFESF